MSIRGSEAYAYDALPERPYPEGEALGFDVIAGGGLDAAARRSVSRRFVHVLGVLALICLLVVSLGSIRVAITTETVSYLNENLELRGSISALEEANSSLKIERSVLSSSSRITRIATQNYGMVFAASRDRIALPTEEMRAALANRPKDAEEDEPIVSPLGAPDATEASDPQNS